MATYPGIIGASAKSHRMKQIFSTATTSVKPVRKLPYQPKGPNMFKRMIKGLVNWSFKDNHTNEISIQEKSDEVRISSTGIKFEVYRANGGTVIETRRFDRRSGDNIFELHVITDSQDIGAELGRIITMEALKS